MKLQFQRHVVRVAHMQPRLNDGLETWRKFLSVLGGHGMCNAFYFSVRTNFEKRDRNNKNRQNDLEMSNRGCSRFPCILQLYTD